MKVSDFVELFRRPFAISEWTVTNDEYTYRCKLCGYVIAGNQERKPQCPSCGAIMRDVKED